MSAVLAPLRRNLDALPSPDPDHPGLLLRDSFGYSERVLVIPPQLVRSLQYFDGTSTENDLREFLVRASGSFDVGEQLKDLVAALSESGFLEDPVYFSMRDAAHAQYAAMTVRPPAFAGSAYPECPEDCRRYFDAFLEGAETLPPAQGRVIGIAAPHVSFEGGPECYRDAFRALKEIGPGKTFIVLATSHYGQPDKFSVTRKPFLTPYGQTNPATDLLDELTRLAPGALIEDEFCQVMEHSAEFHIVWLQHLFGADVKVLPILVGSYANSIYGAGEAPEANPDTAAFLAALSALQEKHTDDLAWVLSIDMAHMGQRYGDDRPYAENDDSIRRLDESRVDDLKRGDIDRFWRNIQLDQDPWKWCGSAPLYTLYKALPNTKAELLRYGQWSIDEASVVSFAGMRFVQ